MKTGLKFFELWKRRLGINRRSEVSVWLGNPAGVGAAVSPVSKQKEILTFLFILSSLLKHLA